MRNRALRLALVAGLTVCAALAADVPAALGNAQNYWNGNVAAFDHRDGHLLPLTDSYSSSDVTGNRTCSGAVTSGGSFFGSYFCATSYACHDYGGETLRARAHNGMSSTILLYGAEWWNGEYASGCPRGA